MHAGDQPGIGFRGQLPPRALEADRLPCRLRRGPRRGGSGLEGQASRVRRFRLGVAARCEERVRQVHDDRGAGRIEAERLPEAGRGPARLASREEGEAEIAVEGGLARPRTDRRPKSALGLRRLARCPERRCPGSSASRLARGPRP